MSDNVRLPKEGVEFTKLSDAALKLRLDWVADPPPPLIQMLDDRIIKLIYKIKYERLAEIYKIEAKMLREMSELIPK